ncbi:MAG: MarC family protein [Dehalococcoidales bacterium]|nr:MarC family protein [Dehalococcoidales bacterium]
MGNFFNDLILTFIPLFIVIDAFGNLPFVVTMGEDMVKRQRRKMVHLAIVTATVVGLIFLFFGQFILNVLDISVGSFAIAGGIILLILSVQHMMTGHMVSATKEEMVAVVPIGTPLTVGPATITTLLLLVIQFPLYIVLIAFVINMLLTWAIFLLSQKIAGFMGQGGLRAISRVFSLLLAAIAVSMMIHGLNILGIIATKG